MPGAVFRAFLLRSVYPRLARILQRVGLETKTGFQVQLRGVSPDIFMDGYFERTGSIDLRGIFCNGGMPGDGYDLLSDWQSSSLDFTATPLIVHETDYLLLRLQGYAPGFLLERTI